VDLETFGTYLAIALAVIIGAVGLADAVIILTIGRESSITALVHRLSHEYPAIPLGAGMLIGHLFL
jgi:hypothetical protein